MKPPFTMDYDEAGDCLYIHGADHGPAYRSLDLGGIVCRFAESGALIGITVINPTDFQFPE